MNTKTTPTLVSTTAATVTEMRYLIPDFDMFTQAVNENRVEPTDGAKPKPYIKNISSAWKLFLSAPRFLSKKEVLYQSTISAMMSGKGVSDEARASTLLVAMKTAIEKLQLDIEQPTIIKIKVTVSRKEK
jgi:hypothetical protein